MNIGAIRIKLHKLKTAIADLEGVSIPWDIIKHNLVPLDQWIDVELKKLDDETEDE